MTKASRRTSSARKTCAGRSEPRHPRRTAASVSPPARQNAASPLGQPSRSRARDPPAWTSSEESIEGRASAIEAVVRPIYPGGGSRYREGRNTNRGISAAGADVLVQLEEVVGVVLCLEGC